jgi:voltage-gated potassium channel
MVTIAVVASIIYGTLGFHYFEEKSWPDSIYWAVTTMSTVGYGDLSPETGAGRIHAMLLMVMGIGTFGLVVEGFISMLLELTEKRKKGLIKVKDQNHILVCGWSETIRECIQELQDLSEEVYIIGEDSEIHDFVEQHRGNLTFVKGDPTRWEDLKRAGAERASIILIDLPTDSQALDCVVTLRPHSDARIVVEVERSENQSKLQSAGADEVTIPCVLSGRLMAQAKSKPYLSRFVTEVVSTNVGMSLMEVRVDEQSKLCGKKMSELAGPDYLPDSVVLALAREDRLIVDTRGEMEIKSGDHLICIESAQQT